MTQVDVYSLLGRLFVENVQHQQDKAELGAQLEEIKLQVAALTRLKDQQTGSGV